MNSTPRKSGHPASQISFFAQFTVAMILFTGLALFLFWPVLKTFKRWDYLIPCNSVLAATGCFLLSRRWLASFDASAVAGAVYGFGPFLLSFKIYHPLAGLIVAFLPWMLCPATLRKQYTRATRLILIQRFLLLLLPFAGIILYFWLPAQSWLGPYALMPCNQQPDIIDLITLLGLLSPHNSQVTIGLYANAFILALMGLFVYLAVLRITVLIPVLCSIVLSFLQPIGYVPPIIWLAIPMLFLAILAGLGSQAFAWAGQADYKWILFCSSAAALLVGICGLKGWIISQETAFRYAAAMYMIALLLTASLFFLVKGNLRWHLFRWIMIGTALGAELFFSGRLLISSAR